MTIGQNLTAEQWSKVLESTSEPKALAQRIAGGWNMPWAETLERLLDGCRSTLDLGCGKGELSVHLARAGKQTTLFDLSETNLQFCRGLYSELKLSGDFHQGDMTRSLKYSDGQFDAAFSCGVFEYFTDEQIVAILKEMFRVSKKRVVALVPNAASVAYRLGKWHLERAGRWVLGGERPFFSLKKQFHLAGYGRVREITVGGKLSLNFLQIRGGACAKRWIEKIARLTDHPRPSCFRQGYLLISTAEKN